MAVVERSVSVPPETVFEILSDGWLYGLWVVGAAHIRDVDEGWPAVGSRIHHAFGAWPLMLQDVTEVREVDPPRRLVLQARGWPAGTARIALGLEPWRENGTTISIEEEPTSGIGAVLHNPLFDALLRRRNIETLARLEHLVQRRQTRH